MRRQYGSKGDRQGARATTLSLARMQPTLSPHLRSTQRMKAAVFHGPNLPLSIEDVELDKPQDREVLIKTVASGVCHSDLHFVDGFYPCPAPAVLGHEAAGIIEEVGKQVTY